MGGRQRTTRESLRAFVAVAGGAAITRRFNRRLRQSAFPSLRKGARRRRRPRRKVRAARGGCEAVSVIVFLGDYSPPAGYGGNESECQFPTGQLDG